MPVGIHGIAQLTDIFSQSDVVLFDASALFNDGNFFTRTYNIDSALDLSVERATLRCQYQEFIRPVLQNAASCTIKEAFTEAQYLQKNMHRSFAHMLAQAKEERRMSSKKTLSQIDESVSEIEQIISLEQDLLFRTIKEFRRITRQEDVDDYYKQICLAASEKTDSQIDYSRRYIDPVTRKRIIKRREQRGYEKLPTDTNLVAHALDFAMRGSRVLLLSADGDIDRILRAVQVDLTIARENPGLFDVARSQIKSTIIYDRNLFRQLNNTYTPEHLPPHLRALGKEALQILSYSNPSELSEEKNASRKA